MAVKKIIKQVGKGSVNIKHQNGAEEQAVIDVHTGKEVYGTPALIHVEMGNTVNTGNYESSKFTVGITMPCHADAIEETYTMCQEWVNDKLTTLNQELQDQLQ